MRSSKDIRETFLQFFQQRGHKIVPSAPIVNKNDPTLMFTNAGMNQFKDYFLGHRKADTGRIADTQKCLRVSGKHNDLEDVGLDGYHHTMFEMLGNWSFGDYFKKEAIAWAWELITKEFGVSKDRLYVSVFKGDESEQLSADEEAAEYWKEWIAADRVLYFSKKDNFWEMGDTGPCGPCSEIHVDLRSDAERAVTDGAGLVNADHPDVIEIWNLVFIQFNRKADGTLEELPAKHVDTGMGFERLCRVVQGTASNYDTDVFQPFIDEIASITGARYTASYDPANKKDIAFRVVTDHLRAVSFTIADGQLPANTGAGYVIRRILRRAVRYYFSFLEYKEPLLWQLIGTLCDQFGSSFPELEAQKTLLVNVIREEERSFLRTLDAGLRRLEQIQPEQGVLAGSYVFELYDTYGFPADLTRLIASEKGWTIDEPAFQKALQEQQDRSRADAQKSFGDWHTVRATSDNHFVGYDQWSVSASHIVKHRTIEQKGKQQYQIVLDETPFYPEGGGQVGDTGYLEIAGERVRVLDTYRENDLIVHSVERLPASMDAEVHAFIDADRRRLIENNHSATHLLHAALRQVLGDHVQQKGSLVSDDYLRFDFSHFQKMSQEELTAVEQLVNRKIRENIPREEARRISIAEAKLSGAMMLFGEKYGDEVRMITFDPGYSVELCGGCHVQRTGSIGSFRIVSEGAVAAGVRRIEAVTAEGAEAWADRQWLELRQIKELLKAPDAIKAVETLQHELKSLRKDIEQLQTEQAGHLRKELMTAVQALPNGLRLVSSVVPVQDAKVVKTLAHQVLEQLDESGAVVLGYISREKPQLLVLLGKEALSKQLHAGNIVRDAAARMSGGGGGQPFFATAGGSDATALQDAVTLAADKIASVH